MTPDQPRFDDPALKAAIRRAWSDETAPAALRRRVEAMLIVEQVSPVGPRMWRQKFAALGMAAAVAILAGAGIIALQRQSKPTEPVLAPVTGLAATLPADLGKQLVRSHDLCARMHPDDHHLFKEAPQDNFKAIAKQMAAALSYPVVATPMGRDWDFRGAAVCPVGRTKSAHLLYTRGDAFVSVFSLPASTLPSCSNHQNCDAAFDGHPVAGFVEAGGFYCVVASSTGGGTPVDLQQVRAMRDQLRVDIVALNEQRTRIAAAGR